MRKTVLQLTISLGISAACLIWLLSRVDLAALVKTVITVHPAYYIAGCGFIALMYLIRALRWRIVLRPCGDCGVKGLFSANTIGYMANNILPFRMGELVRAYSASQIVKIPVSAALGSIMVERVLDGLGLCLMVFLTLLFMEPDQANQYVSTKIMSASAGLLLVLFLGVLAVLVCLSTWPQKASSVLCGLAGKISKRMAEWLERAIGQFSMGLVSLRRLNDLPMLVFYTLLIWLNTFFLHLVFLPALGLPLDPVMASLAMVGANLALTIPAAPGYVGTMQLGQVAAMMLGGAPQAVAIDYAMVGWAAVYFPITIAGLAEMWRQGMSLGGLKRRAAELSGQK